MHQNPKAYANYQSLKALHEAGLTLQDLEPQALLYLRSRPDQSLADMQEIQGEIAARMRRTGTLIIEA